MAAPASPSFVRRQSGPLLVLLTVVWAVATLILFSDGAISVYTDMLVLYLGAGVVAVAFLLVVIAGSPPDAAGGPRRRRWPWLVPTMLIVASLPSACRYGVPFRLRFSYSRPALEAMVQRMPGDRADGVQRGMGMLPVARIDRTDGVIRFTTGSCGLGEACGVAYSPRGTPPFREGASYKPLRHAGWWAFSQRR